MRRDGFVIVITSLAKKDKSLELLPKSKQLGQCMPDPVPKGYVPPKDDLAQYIINEYQTQLDQSESGLDQIKQLEEEEVTIIDWKTRNMTSPLAQILKIQGNIANSSYQVPELSVPPEEPSTNNPAAALVDTAMASTDSHWGVEGLGGRRQGPALVKYPFSPQPGKTHSPPPRRMNALVSSVLGKFWDLKPRQARRGR